MKDYKFKESTDDRYSSMAVYDVDNDGINEIIAGTDNGLIDVLDGENLEKKFTITSASGKRINGIVVDDLNFDNKPDYIFSSDGIIHIYSDSNQYMTTKKYGDGVGIYNGIKVVDLDKDNQKEIMVGTYSSILELSTSCYKCNWFKNDKKVSHVGCDEKNGSIAIQTTQGLKPYEFKWSDNNTDSVRTGLDSGLFVVNIEDSNGCEIVDSVLVEQAKLIADPIFSNESCKPGNDASASVNITTGTPPYNYKWSNGSVFPSISNLSKGNYSLSITDSNKCTFNHEFALLKDTLKLFLEVEDPTCFGFSNGSIDSKIFGAFPFSIKWNNGETIEDLDFLPVGKYTMQITDSKGCTASDSVLLKQPNEIITELTSEPDKKNTIFGDGTATISVIGGVTPYQIKWGDSFNQTTNKAINLLAGTYPVQLRDANNCYKLDTVVVLLDTTLSINHSDFDKNISIFPNPSNGIVYIKTTNLLSFNIEVFTTLGKNIYSRKVDVLEGERASIDLSSFEPGAYNVRITNEFAEINRLIYLSK